MRGRLGSAFDAWAYALADRVGDRWWRSGPRVASWAERVGVPAFSRWFLNGGSRGGRNEPFYRRQRGDRAERLRQLDRFSRGVEVKHWVGLFACSSVPVAAWSFDSPRAAVALLVLNLVGHGYPILSMRWVRSRAVGLSRRTVRGAG